NLLGDEREWEIPDDAPVGTGYDQESGSLEHLPTGRFHGCGIPARENLYITMVAMSSTGLSDRADPRFVIGSFEPGYLELHRSGEILNRVAAGLRELEDCCACPRNCHVNRMAGETRVCHTGRFARVASAFPHFGEEDCLRGWAGSGTIFFSLCNLRCVFRQYWGVTQPAAGADR